MSSNFIFSVSNKNTLCLWDCKKGKALIKTDFENLNDVERFYLFNQDFNPEAALETQSFKLGVGNLKERRFKLLQLQFSAEKQWFLEKLSQDQSGDIQNVEKVVEIGENIVVMYSSCATFKDYTMNVSYVFDIIHIG